jgi:hypothetical protein
LTIAEPNVRFGWWVQLNDIAEKGGMDLLRMQSEKQANGLSDWTDARGKFEGLLRDHSHLDVKWCCHHGFAVRPDQSAFLDRSKSTVWCPCP